MLDLLTSVSPRELRHDQRQAIEALRLSLGKGNKRVVLQAPTGFGKTVVMAKMILSALAKDRNVLVMVPRLSLVDQTITTLEEEGISQIGVLQGHHPRADLFASALVATPQTLSRRILPDHFGLVLVDECHEAHAIVSQLMQRWPQVPFIGFSATPWAKGMGRIWQDLRVAATTRNMIEKGLLSRFRAYAPDEPDLTGVRTVAGDFEEAALGRVMCQRNLVGSVVDTWLEKGEDRPTLCFAVNRAHARSLMERFLSVGVAAAYCDAKTDIIERELIRRRFEAGEIRIVCSVRTLTTGLDWGVSGIIDAAPTKSEILHVQKIGRGLRIKPGTEDLLILDHAGNSTRLGLVSQIHRDRLDDGTKWKTSSSPRREPLPKPCLVCHVLHVGALCPACGHVRQVRSSIVEVPGELVEVTGTQAEEPSHEQLQLWFSGLLWLAGEEGHKPGWAYHVFRDKFGHWPNGLDHPPQPPTTEIRNYAKSRLIAHAKRKQKET
jgi:DNA repair protein RadD